MNTNRQAVPQRVSAGHLPKALLVGLRGGHHTHILDVRYASAFGSDAVSLPDAIPVLLEGSSWPLPDMDRELPILVLTNSEHPPLSLDYARALIRAGYRHVWVLEGGLDAWINYSPQRFTEPVQLEARKKFQSWLVVPAHRGDQPQ